MSRNSLGEQAINRVKIVDLEVNEVMVGKE
jgi:hypothetical protein